MAVIGPKAADMFAFGMFAVEVFTGKIPPEEQKRETVVLRILQRSRLEIPGNAQDICRAYDRDLESSRWRQDPKKRPTVGEAVRRW